MAFRKRIPLVCAICDLVYGLLLQKDRSGRQLLPASDRSRRVCLVLVGILTIVLCLWLVGASEVLDQLSAILVESGNVSASQP